MSEFLTIVTSVPVLLVKAVVVLLAIILGFAIPVVIVFFITNFIFNLKSRVKKNDKSKFTTCAHYYIYKAFLDSIKENNMLSNILTMSYSQIISLLNVPELNICHAIINPCTFYPEEDRALLVIYTFKNEQMHSISFCSHNEKTRKEDGLILFIPKTYRDYRKLCHYFADNDISKLNGDIAKAQMESLKYLTDLIHQVQDKHTKTLQDCQAEMDRELDAEFLNGKRYM